MIWVPALRMAMAAASSRQSAGCASAVVVAGPAGASAGGGTSSLLLTPGVSLLGGPSIVAPGRCRPGCRSRPIARTAAAAGLPRTGLIGAIGEPGSAG
jgi:hypothetical protein